ncbi:hypothetical protein P691DRAFT_612995, partial [Macrolepiota fuliginosa MF-IS2]
DIHKALVNQYIGDNFFRLILSNPATYKNFKVNNGLVFLRSNRKCTLCIPDILNNGQRVWEIIISHAHCILTHLSLSKTTTYLQDSVWWKGMGSDILTFCNSC